MAYHTKWHIIVHKYTILDAPTVYILYQQAVNKRQVRLVNTVLRGVWAGEWWRVRTRRACDNMAHHYAAQINTVLVVKILR